MPRERATLGEFLRVRRDAMTPAEAGMKAFPGARRVPGLRREELAVLAGVSPDYYSRVEQGRQAHVSPEILDSLARALRLDAVETAHLHDLAAPATRRRRFHEAPEVADPGLLRLMTTLDHVPVLLLGRRGDVLARNAILESVVGARLEPGTSFLEYLFRDPVARERILNWETFARSWIETMRREIGRRPDDVALREIADDIRRTDADAALWWDEHGVRDSGPSAKLIRHPLAGDLTFDIEVLRAPQAPEQLLVVYTVEPGSTTSRILPLLASWDATEVRAI